MIPSLDLFCSEDVVIFNPINIETGIGVPQTISLLAKLFVCDLVLRANKVFYKNS